MILVIRRFWEQLRAATTPRSSLVLLKPSDGLIQLFSVVNVVSFCAIRNTPLVLLCVSPLLQEHCLLVFKVLRFPWQHPFSLARQTAFDSSLVKRSHCLSLVLLKCYIVSLLRCSWNSPRFCPVFFLTLSLFFCLCSLELSPCCSESQRIISPLEAGFSSAHVPWPTLGTRRRAPR